MLNSVHFIAQEILPARYRKDFRRLHERAKLHLNKQTLVYVSWHHAERLSNESQKFYPVKTTDQYFSKISYLKDVINSSDSFKDW